MLLIVSMSHQVQQELGTRFGPSEASPVDGHVADLSSEGAEMVCGSHLHGLISCL